MLETALKKSAALRLTLAGVNQRLEQILSLHVVRANNNNPKGALALKTREKKAPYPQGWWYANSISFDTEIAPSMKNIGRFGSGWKLSKLDGSGATNAVVFNNHYFPVRIDCSLTVRCLQEEDMLNLIQRALIASGTEMMSFEIQAGTTKWTCRVRFEGNTIPIPRIDDLDNSTAEAGMLEIEIPMTISTKIGFNLEKAKINNLGEVAQNYDVDTLSGGNTNV